MPIMEIAWLTPVVEGRHAPYQVDALLSDWPNSTPKSRGGRVDASHADKCADPL